MKHTLLPAASLQKTSFLLETCIHPTSRRILKLLTKHQEMTLIDLNNRFCISADKVRFQLGLLQKLNIVKKVSKKDGILYYLNSSKLLKIKLLVNEFSDNYILEGVS
ncbi:MAG: helix-turn-helix domain-containing protein [Bacteroidetes bacterium]|jgi:predicted transcriptional regulator|nr:helix-turn-helix domain-containing protein [Bacteroidota bacterium]MDF1864736.1 helix-turn-helix domain-containing protein [Saprospiraceae bacterium]